MKSIIVTGATRGLGLAIARRLLADGFYVVLTGRRVTAEVEQLIEEFTDAASFFPFDMADIDGIHGFVKHVTAEVGVPWGLVNNAAIGTEGVLGTMHNADIERTLRINTFAPIVLTKYVSRTMLAKRAGRIVNVSSVIASTGFSGLSVYGATKSAMTGFTKSLARELGRAEITVNSVAPGYMETEMTTGLGDTKLDSIRRRSALNRLVEPADVAEMVAYLMSDTASAVTGTEITIDAGSTA